MTQSDANYSLGYYVIVLTLLSLRQLMFFLHVIKNTLNGLKAWSALGVSGRVWKPLNLCPAYFIKADRRGI
jgi:hypothetical protein